VIHANKREKALRSHFALLNVFGNLGRLRLNPQYRSPPSAPQCRGKSEGIEKASSLLCHLLVMLVPLALSNAEDDLSDYSGSVAAIRLRWRI